MEVADTIVVMNDGRIEQIGSPRDIYDMPASDFVMSFIGPVTRVAGDVVRPHDLDVLTERAEASVEAMVERIVHLGFEVRLELVAADGTRTWAQLSRVECEQLELVEGQIVYLRPGRPASRAPIAAV